MTSGDEIWDEEQWEAFLRLSDERIRRYMDLLFAFLADDPPPEAADTAGRRAWEGRLRRFLAEKGFEQDPALFQPFGDEDRDEDEALDDDAPGTAALGRPAGYGDIPVYRRASDLATRILEWTNGLPGAVKDSTLVQFCTSVTQVPAHLAEGHRIGYEREMIGGNIACAKRGLAAANSALDQLAELRTASYMTPDFYRHLYEQVFEVRNELGLYVQDLRARFNLGVD
jgi:hypothetical protein